jgi:SAM-dependent methyltransferase
MSSSEAPDLGIAAATVYEEVFVPALFAEWGARVVDAARVAPGSRVLDVACGTGVLARAAAERVGPTGRVIGLDRSAGMLEVAARRAPGIEFRRGSAESLPFPDASFDAALSQFGLMFFNDRASAIREMWRVVRPGGRVAIAVWASLEETPAYRTVVALLERLFGAAVADGMRAPFCLGDRDSLRRVVAAAGVGEPEIATIVGSGRFPSIRDWVRADAKGWLELDDAQLERLAREAESALASFRTADGSVAFASPAHLAILERQ